MQLQLYITLLMMSATVAALDDVRKCPFRDTVDLTNQKSLQNGSYLYQGILIPTDKLTHYNYSRGFQNRLIPTDLHVRGCVCNATLRIHCVKLCCENGEYLSGSPLRCEKMSEDMPMDFRIRLLNKTYTSVNIFKHFVYQVGLPCKKPEIISTGKDAWDLLETGVLDINNEYIQLNTLSYCLTPYRRNISDKYSLMAMSCPIKQERSVLILINTYGMAASVVFLIPTILVYLLEKKLRGNFENKLLICYLISMAVGYSIIGYVNISETHLEVPECRAVGFTGYFCFMSMFMWLNAIGFEIWYRFKDNNFESNPKKDIIRFFKYSLYAWGLATLMTVNVVWAQLSDLVTDSYKPGIGHNLCWLDTRQWSAAIYFYIPNCIIVVINIIIFTNLNIRIYTTKRDVNSMSNQEKSFRQNALRVMRISLIMGVSWFMDIVSYIFRNYNHVEYVFAITDFCTVMQGFLIFVLFVLLKPEVLALLKTRLGIRGNNNEENCANIPLRT